MGLTKLVLRRPVSTVLAILCLIVFGLSSVMKSPLELMPDMNMSMMIVMTVYSGASPDDVSELVTKPIEDRASTLSGLDTISSQSKENMSIVMLKYKYGTDMNDAYDDLKKLLNKMIAFDLSSKEKQEGIYFVENLEGIKEILK
jgi:multidrug efflux pump subunit AcrB